MSEFNDDDFEEVPIDEAELPPVPPEFADIPDPAAAQLPAQPGESGIDTEERNWAVGAHLSALLTFVVPIPGVNIIAPLVVWQMKKDSMPYVAYHAKEALNFNITSILWFIAAFVAGLALFVLGLLLTLPLVALVWLILVVVAATKAANHEYYRYPFTIRFVK